MRTAAVSTTIQVDKAKVTPVMISKGISFFSI